MRKTLIIGVVGEGLTVHNHLLTRKHQNKLNSGNYEQIRSTALELSAYAKKNNVAIVIKPKFRLPRKIKKYFMALVRQKMYGYRYCAEDYHQWKRRNATVRGKRSIKKVYDPPHEKYMHTGEQGKTYSRSQFSRSYEKQWKFPYRYGSTGMTEEQIDKLYKETHKIHD